MKLQAAISAAITVSGICFTSTIYASSSTLGQVTAMHAEASSSGTVTHTSNISEGDNSITFDAHWRSTFDYSSSLFGVSFANSYGFGRHEVGNLGIDLSIDGYADEQFYARASAGVIVAFSDQVTVASGSLPFGTPVQVELFHTLEYVTGFWLFLGTPGSTLTNSISLNSTWDIISSAGHLNAYHIGGIGFNESNVINDSFVVDTFVGDTISIWDQMRATISADMSALTDDSPLDNASAFSGALGASHSAHTYMKALTPGVSLISDSGHDYSPISSIPEPETYTMLLAGLGLLGFIARRHKILSSDLNV